MRAPLIDAHCHLQDAAFLDDLDSVLARARSVGVEQWVSCGTSEADWSRLRAIADRCPDVLPQFGLHPWDAAARSPDWLDRLKSQLQGSCCGVGEIGLDATRTNTVSPETQISVFREQWLLSCRLELPMTIHCVKAWSWLDRLFEELPTAPRKFLLHCYAGSVEMLPRLIDRGALFSVGGRVLDPGAAKLRAIATFVPLDRLLVESDAPAMPPRPPYYPAEFLRPRGIWRNEPLLLPAIVKEIAMLRGLTVASLARVVTENTTRLFLDSRRSGPPPADGRAGRAAEDEHSTIVGDE